MAIVGGSETPRERIERLIADGQLERQALEQAEEVWQARLHVGVSLPNDDVVHVTQDDLYHAIIDPRLARRPDRIEAALQNVFEVRQAEGQRRLGLSRWLEDGMERLAVVIIEVNNTLRSIHLVDDRRLRRYQRQYPEVLWR
ncbi:MAG: hypothetical protein ACR2PL_16815 [Dehalococcoidia bacterium]